MDIKPHFYDEFRCIADKCHMTCCMQWKIAVDEKTLSRWKKTFLNEKRLDIPVKKCGREGIIRLNKNGDCPYLKEGFAVWHQTSAKIFFPKPAILFRDKHMIFRTEESYPLFPVALPSLIFCITTMTLYSKI